LIEDMGVKFKTGVEVGKDISLDKLREQGFKAFYLAVGASKGTKVGCPGDDMTGVFTGIDFLREVNLFEKPAIGKSVAVIGGGDVVTGPKFAIDAIAAGNAPAAVAKLVTKKIARKQGAAMHEIGVVRSMVKTVLDIGELSLVIPKYVEDIYPVVVGDAWLKDTKLVINVIPGMAECDECNELFNVIEHEGYCPNCGSFEKTILSGKDFLIREIHIPED
jgi:Zn finger protein HypA/HybF involved in hydrogenase expression